MRKLQPEELEVITATYEAVATEWGYRRGQAFFNVLQVHYPDVAESITGTDFDPFYDDKKISRCISHILYQ